VGGAYRALHSGLLLGGAYRALLIFGVMLLAGRIAPVISVVVFDWVERIAPVRVWVWLAWWCSGGLVLFFRLVARVLFLLEVRWLADIFDF
jgi:hypothetical protein